MPVKYSHKFGSLPGTPLTPIRGGGGGGGVPTFRPGRATAGSQLEDESWLFRAERLKQAEAERQLREAQAQQVMQQTELQRKQWDEEHKPIGLETYYTPQQQQQLSRNEDAKRRVMESKIFTPDEKTEALRQIAENTNSIVTNPSKRLLNPNSPQFEPGQEPGKLWTHPETGTVMTTVLGKDGKTPEPKLVVRPNQTAQYAEMQQQLKTEALKMQIELQGQSKLELAEMDMRIKLAQKDDAVVTGTDRKTGKPTGFRGYNEDEIEDIIKRSGVRKIGGQSGLPVVANDIDYERLPSGTMFTDSEGKRYRKP